MLTGIYFLIDLLYFHSSTIQVHVLLYMMRTKMHQLSHTYNPPRAHYSPEGLFNPAKVHPNCGYYTCTTVFALPLSLYSGHKDCPINLRRILRVRVSEKKELNTLTAILC